MANATVTLVLDRIHAINETISGVKAKRYFPQNINNTAIYPFVVPMVGRMTTRSRVSGAQFEHVTREYSLLLVVEAWMAGIPTESASTDAETLIESITNAYIQRPRLELAAQQPLDGVKEIHLGEDSGITALDQGLLVAVVRWSLLVTTIKQFTFV